jgi:hypothetical protein
VLVQRGSCGGLCTGEGRHSPFGVRVRVLIDACTTGKLWRIVYLRRAKFSVWFSGVGTGWCLYNWEAVENCEPEKGGILRLVFGRGSLLVRVQRGSYGELCT